MTILTTYIDFNTYIDINTNDIEWWHVSAVTWKMQEFITAKIHGIDTGHTETHMVVLF